MKDGLIWKDQLICSIRQVTFFPLNLYVRGYIWRNRKKQEHLAGWVCSYIYLRTLKTMFLHGFLLNLWAVPVQSLQLKSYLQRQSFFLRFKEVFGWWKHFTICNFSCLFDFCCVVISYIANESLIYTEMLCTNEIMIGNLPSGMGRPFLAAGFLQGPDVFLAAKSVGEPVRWQNNTAVCKHGGTPVPWESEMTVGSLQFTGAGNPSVAMLVCQCQIAAGQWIVWAAAACFLLHTSLWNGVRFGRWR